jgi:anti-sigma factor RsiW
MKCPMETRESEILLAYSSGRLDAGTTSRLDGHLESCPACRDFVAAQRTVWDALSAWQAAPVSADFDRRLYQRVDRQVAWLDRLLLPWQGLGLRRVAPIAVSAGVVLMAGLLLVQPSATPPPKAGTVQMEAFQPEQLVRALDEMEALSQLSRPVADSKM